MKRLVLLGGGHTHVEVIRQIGLDPPPGVEVALVSPDRHTPYSGMLPGFVSGHYTFDDCHIDLERLCSWAKVRFCRLEALGVDPRGNTVALGDGTTLPYDVLSVDVGSTPPTHAVPGALEHTLRVKPVSRFLRVWDEIRHRAEREQRMPRIAVIGGGAGGVELALALDYRLGQCSLPRNARVHVFTDSATILPGHAARVISIVGRILVERDVTVHAHNRVERVERGLLHTAGGGLFEADHIVWVTGASAPAWIAASGIQTDGGGFIAVNACLQSVSHANVFAAGDVASMVGHRLPKSGVYAVRQGPPLATNLRQVLASGRLIPYVPQRTALALISAGNRYAVASYGNVAFEGAWVWRWKDVIDRRFMRRYHEAAFA